jgi:hypothetical protein
MSHLDGLLVPLVSVGAIIGFFFVAVVAAGLWEKRLVQPYRVPAAGEEYTPTADARRANQEAGEIGFRHGGLCHDAKGKMYRVRYDFWLSRDSSTIAIIASGSIAVLPVYGISLYSRTADGEVLCTTNDIGEQDISGVEIQQTWPKMPFKPLVKKHRQRFTEVDVKPFPEESPMAGYFEIRRRKADAMVEQGLTYYLDDDHRVWRHTLYGALWFYVIGVWVRPIGRFLRSIGLVRA